MPEEKEKPKIGDELVVSINKFAAGIKPELMLALTEKLGVSIDREAVKKRRKEIAQTVVEAVASLDVSRQEEIGRQFEDLRTIGMERKNNLVMVSFCKNNGITMPETSPYTAPESLGETEETLRNRNKELWAKEGENRDIDEFGLQPADWAKLVGDTLSHKAGRLQAKDDERITTQALELGVSGIKERAQSCYKCAPPEKMNDSWWHCCSQWTFAVDLHLDWPFGFTAKENAEWYERAVICVWNEGYDRDGGNGCHDSYILKIFSLPDGRELGVEDYFAPDKLKALSAFVTKRFYNEHLDEEEAAEKSKWPLDLTGDEVSMLVSKEGVTWTWVPYSVLPGCEVAPSIFIKWQELKEFRDESCKETAVRASSIVDTEKQKGEKR